MPIYFTLQQLNQLNRILDNALTNPELFTDIDEDYNEFFDSNLHGDVKRIKNTIKEAVDKLTPF